MFTVAQRPLVGNSDVRIVSRPGKDRGEDRSEYERMAVRALQETVC